MNTKTSQETNNKLNIPVDGVASSGKGTLTKPLAELLGYKLLDAGSMYRAVAVFFDQRNINPDEVPNYLERIENINYDGQIPYVNNEPYCDNIIRTPHVDKIVAQYGAKPRLKRLIIDAQNLITSQTKGWIAEGRNMAFDAMGNPDTTIYLYADIHVRALRRWMQQRLPQHEFINVLADLKLRDDTDINHQNPPLMRPEDAKKHYEYFIDTTYGSEYDNFLKLVDISKQKGALIQKNKLEHIIKKYNFIKE
ncbi:MAG: (d)CMP kinase [Nanoarchaeota archaeon]